MLELNQFRHSAFCLKVKMVLEAKQLSYKVKEITPGIGQIAIFRLSGQKQLPVLVDGSKVINDSSAIVRYLENLKPEPSLIPEDPKHAAQAHLIEDWADTTLARSAQLELLKATTLDAELRNNLFTDVVPKPLQTILQGLPIEFLTNTKGLLNIERSENLLTSLEQLAIILESSEWLIGRKMSIADIAVAAQLSLLRFPPSAGSELARKGCPAFSNHPDLQPLFQWRDQLEVAIGI